MLARRTCLLLLCSSSFLSVQARGEPEGEVRLVVDLVDAADPSAGLEPFSITTVGDRLYFTGRHPLTGTELWTSDGTAEGTRLVAESCPGPCGISSLLVALEDAVYFESCDDVPVCQLWRSDGTAEGTEPITRLSRQSARVRQLTAAGGTLYFVASDAVLGEELHRSDGTRAGTELVADVAPGRADAGIREMAALGDRVLFEAAIGRELWISNGTTAGTRRLRTLPLDSFINEPIRVAGDRAFFVERFFDLWTSDGTEAGTRQVVHQDRVISLLATLSGRVFFSQLSEDYSGNELWVSDGTRAGTRRVRGGFPFTRGPSHGLEKGGEVYFASGEQLWKTDGTEAGTVLVAGLEERIEGLAALADDLFAGTRGGLWRVDGDGDPHRLAGDLRADLLVPFGNGVAFRAESDTDGEELAVAGGDAVTFLSDVVDPGSSHPTDLLAHREGLLFLDSLDPKGVYLSDGTAAGTERVGELESFRLAEVSRTVTAGGLAFVVADDLWRVGSGGTLHLLFDDQPEGSEAERRILRDTAVAFAGRLFFLVWNFENDHIELWASDGTKSGTGLYDQLQEFRYCFICDPPLPFPTWDLVVAGRRLFARFEGRLWSSRGLEGVAREIELDPVCGHLCALGPMAGVGDRLFFTTALFRAPGALPDPRRLWVSNGISEGTFVVAELALPDPDGRPARAEEFLALGDTLFFTLHSPELGDELWRSDGASAGTYPVIDLRAGPESSNPRHLTAARGTLFFTADDGVSGRELWRSDGTAGGTRPVADLRPGPASSSPGELARIDGLLYFAADDGQLGREPWVTDGTSDGTRRLADLEPGLLPSSPASFVAAGQQVFFSAGTHELGFELYSAPREICESCLAGNRFQVAVEWSRDGVVRPAERVDFSDQTSLFWFFQRSNTELLVKVVDGRTINDHFWVFYGALSDVEYEIRVEDRFTGAVRTYRNPQGNLCGDADTAAFRDDLGAVEAPVERDRRVALPQPANGPCPSGPQTLCLRDGRFGVEVEWTELGGTRGRGQALPDTDQTGYFWFFHEDNLELAVKLLDGRAINDKLWFFYGALSDVGYQITVTDFESGAVRTYDNPQGEICGRADVAAFDP